MLDWQMLGGIVVAAVGAVSLGLLGGAGLAALYNYLGVNDEASDSTVVPFERPHGGADVQQSDRRSDLHHLSVGVPRHSLPQNYIRLVVLDEWDDTMTKH